MILRRPLLVIFFCFIVLDCVWYYFWRGSGDTAREAQDNTAIRCEGKIEQIWIKKSGEALILGDVKMIYEGTGVEQKISKIIVYQSSEGTSFPSVQIGNVISVVGTNSIFECASNPGGFDEKLYYESQGIGGRVYADSFTVLDPHTDRVSQGMFMLRKRVMEQLLRVMNESDAGVLGAMILGEKNHLPDDIKELYQQTGIGHILAISGLHISLIGSGLFFFLRRFVLPMKKAVMVTILFLFLYGRFTGFPVATVRAVWMMCMALLARYSGRSYDPLSALSLSGIFTLLNQPLQLFQCGFLLSYTAIGGILLFSPVMERLSPCFHKKKGWGVILEAVLSSGFITLFTLPVMLYFFYEICPYSVIANVVILPLLSLLIGTGAVGCAISFLWQTGGSFLLSTTHCVLVFYELVCRGIEALPGSRVITGRPSVLFFVCYYGVLAGMVYVYVRWDKKMAFGVCGLILCVLLWFVSPSFEFLYTQLDVGQGDCACIFYRDKTYLIDGGSSSEEQIGKYTIQRFLKYYGRKSVDGIFITHSDADHTNGLEELIENRREWGLKAEAVIMPKIEKKDDEYTALLRQFKKFNIKIIQMKKGDVAKEGAFQLRCLHPSPDYEWNSENDYSLTMEITYRDLRILTTGDLEESGERSITGLEGGYDVLKVGHHGSKSSTSQEFLDMVCPQNAILSAGRRNRYGHPSPVTLEKLEKKGTRIWCTMDCGAVFAEWRKGKRISAYRN